MNLMPKGFKKKINLINQLVGFDRRQELLDDINLGVGFLPNGVSYEDIDSSFIEFITNDVSYEFTNEKIPVIFLTLQRWSEFSETWQYSDEYKDIKLPFVTVVRDTSIQTGTNQAGNWNTPGSIQYGYYKVPTFENGRVGVDLYKIPQPTSVDLIYEVRLFCNKMKDLNKFSEIIHRQFQSRQFYIYPNQHPMPLHLESVSDESNVDDFENRKFYVQLFEIKLLGYIQDENDFKIVPTVSRINVSEVLSLSVLKPKITKKELDTVTQLTYDFIIKPKTSNKFRFSADFNTRFNNIITDNLNSIIFIVNNETKEIPFTVNSGDIIVVKFIRDNNNIISQFTLNGDIL